MIKCDYFGKLLKQGLFTLLISCFILLGSSSVSAVNIQKNGQYVVSALDSSIDIQVNNKGQLMSTRLGNTKRILSFISNDSEKIFFWFGPGKKPYSFVQFPGRGENQGFYNRYLLCDELTSGSTSIMDNCSSFDISSDFSNEMGSFFQSITVNDYWGYDIHTWDCFHSPQLVNRVCFSSSEFHKSICFANGMGNSSVCQCDYCNDTNSSLNLDYDRQFTAIPDSVIETPPGFTYGGDSQGSVDVGNGSIELTGDYVYRSCTYGEILKRLESDGFNNYLCYGGIDNFDLYDSSVNYNVIPGSGKTLAQILVYSNAWDTPQEWFDFWNGLYQDKNNSSYLSMWSSYPAVYRTWFDLYYQYGGSIKNFDYVREYCSMKSLNVSSDTVYHGKYFEGVCDTVNDELQYGYGVFGSSGEIIVGTNWNGVGNFSGKVQSNAVEFIQDFFNKAKSVVPTSFPNSGFGFLPTYILTFLCAIILFRFISH